MKRRNSTLNSLDVPTDIPQEEVVDYLLEKLREKDNELILAAEIGQTLIKENQHQQERLEESLRANELSSKKHEELMEERSHLVSEQSIAREKQSNHDFLELEEKLEKSHETTTKALQKEYLTTQRNTQLSNEVKKLKAENEKLREDLDQREELDLSALDKANRELAQKERELRQVEEKLDHKRTEYHEQQAQLQKLTEERKRTYKGLQEVERQLKDKSSELSEFDPKLQDAQNRLDLLSTQKTELLEEIGTLKEIDDLKSQLESAEKENKKLQQELDNPRQNLGDLEEIDRLKQELEEARKQPDPTQKAEEILVTHTTESMADKESIEETPKPTLEEIANNFTEAFNKGKIDVDKVKTLQEQLFKAGVLAELDIKEVDEKNKANILMKCCNKVQKCLDEGKIPGGETSKISIIVRKIKEQMLSVVWKKKNSKISHVKRELNKRSAAKSKRRR